MRHFVFSAVILESAMPRVMDLLDPLFLPVVEAPPAMTCEQTHLYKTTSNPEVIEVYILD